MPFVFFVKLLFLRGRICFTTALVTLKLSVFIKFGKQELVMFAIIEQGSKQYKVSQGDVIKIELTEVAPESTAIELNKVLFFSDGTQVKIGTPYLEGAKVVAKFETTAEDGVVKGVKLFPMHFRRRKASKKRIGHRQKYLQVIIDRIEC